MRQIGYETKGSYYCQQCVKSIEPGSHAKDGGKPLTHFRMTYCSGSYQLAEIALAR